MADSLAADSLAMLIPADSVDSLADSADYDLPVGERIPQRAYLPLRLPVGMRFAGGRFSTDSTIHLYIDPVLWNQNSQITSDVMDIFTEPTSQIARAEFVGRSADGLRVGYDALQPGGGQDDDRPVPQQPDLPQRREGQRPDDLFHAGRTIRPTSSGMLVSSKAAI